MKIRRTLPSVNEYSPMNRKSSTLNISENKGPQFPTFLDIDNDHILKKISSSPQKRIFNLERNSSPSNRQSIEFHRKKTVSFIDPIVRKEIGVKQEESKPYRSSKKHRRSKIFRNDGQSIKNDETIPANISLKWISQHLRKSTHLEVEQKLTKKIAQLQEKVNDISGKVQISEVHQIKKAHGEHIRNFSEIDNSVLKLQLQQMRRCEKIAKENEVLYSKLIKEIEINENSLVSSRKRSYSSYQISPQTKVINQKSTKITAFEDFEQYYNKNFTRDLDESEGQFQISSPFSLEENRGRIKISR